MDWSGGDLVRLCNFILYCLYRGDDDIYSSFHTVSSRSLTIAPRYVLTPEIPTLSRQILVSTRECQASAQHQPLESAQAESGRSV